MNRTVIIGYAFNVFFIIGLVWRWMPVLVAKDVNGV